MKSPVETLQVQAALDYADHWVDDFPAEAVPEELRGLDEDGAP